MKGNERTLYEPLLRRSREAERSTQIHFEHALSSAREHRTRGGAGEEVGQQWVTEGVWRSCGEDHSRPQIRDGGDNTPPNRQLDGVSAMFEEFDCMGIWKGSK